MAIAVQNARSDRGLKLRELARKANIPVSSLARIEAGEVSPSVDTVLDLAHGLGIQIADLLAHIEPSSCIEGGTMETVAGHYLHGWRRDTAADHLKHRYPLDHIGSGQFSKPFRRIQSGDVVWAVYVDEGRLHVVGRMVVASRAEIDSSMSDCPEGVIFTQSEAERVAELRGVRDLWNAPEHLFSPPDRAEQVRHIKVPARVLRSLRFETGSGWSPIKLERDGSVGSQRFRSLRLLTTESADAFERLWRR